jgi:hypothetical protein
MYCDTLIIGRIPCPGIWKLGILARFFYKSKTVLKEELCFLRSEKVMGTHNPPDPALQ